MLVYTLLGVFLLPIALEIKQLGLEFIVLNDLNLYRWMTKDVTLQENGPDSKLQFNFWNICKPTEKHFFIYLSLFLFENNNLERFSCFFRVSTFYGARTYVALLHYISIFRGGPTHLCE